MNNGGEYALSGSVVSHQQKPGNAGRAEAYPESDCLHSSIGASTIGLMTVSFEVGPTAHAKKAVSGGAKENAMYGAQRTSLFNRRHHYCDLSCLACWHDVRRWQRWKV